MRHRPRSIAAALVVLASLPLASGCSKNKGTNPSGGMALELSSGNIGASGGQYAHRFFNAGTYGYHCTIHSGMMGSIVVSGSAPAADSLEPVSITSFSFQPPTQTIPIGGKVTWTNNDPTAHTVTSN
jgi:plastocyanin